MKNLLVTGFVTALALSLFTACGEKPAAASAKAPPAAPTADVLARLAKADAVDGKTDKVVDKCAGCSLGMDGKAEKELVVGDYKMHFCSDGCLGRFQDDPNGQITALKLPQ